MTDRHVQHSTELLDDDRRLPFLFPPYFLGLLLACLFILFVALAENLGVNFLSAELVQLFGSLLVNDLVSGRFRFFLFNILGDLKGLVVEVMVLVLAVVFYPVGVKFNQFLVLLDERELSTFPAIHVFVCLTDGGAVNLTFHFLFGMLDFILVGVFLDNEVHFLLGQKFRKLVRLWDGAQLFDYPN